MARKLPRYTEMSIEELDQHCAKWNEVIVRARKAIREGRWKMPLDEQFRLEMEVGEANAHLNIIQPLRTAHFAREEFERSQQSAFIKGRISKETYEALLQDIGLPHIEPTTTVNGGAIKE